MNKKLRLVKIPCQGIIKKNINETTKHIID